MFYTMYLSSVCQRRQWPDPLYEPVRSRNGYYCKVRVNNREYTTEVPYASEALARDGAAQKAYMIARNFSVNDGMIPNQRPGQRIQGLPVAIGAGRSKRSSAASNRSSAASYDTASTDGTSSGGNSPRSVESGFERGFDQQLRQVMQQAPNVSSRRQQKAGSEYMCLCRRSHVAAYGRCGFCLQESGWA